MIRNVFLAIVGAGLMGCGNRPPIKVGILHSLTGTMAISERSVRDGTLLAIDELNANGGLLGRRVEPVIADGKSDWPTFAVEAERLIVEEKVSVVFGCWTSASRKTVKPVFERHGHLLFYPVQYEGLEQSPHIIYTGATPNQQLIPAVKWCMDQGWRRFFLVGSDYVFPRAANEILRLQIRALRGQVVGEEYLLLGAKDVAPVIDAIAAAKPHVILNTINGDTNVAFFAGLRRASIAPTKIPTVSFSIAEAELMDMDAKAMEGDFAVWNYFQSINSPENKEFVTRFQKRFGADRVTSDPIEAAYFGVHLWAQAVRDADTDNVAIVRFAVPRQSFLAPEGIVTIDPHTHHTWKAVRVGKIRARGQFDIVWDSGREIRPIPFPEMRSRKEWETYLDGLFNGWGGQWANPGNPALESKLLGR